MNNINLKRIIIKTVLGAGLFVSCVKNNLGHHNMRGLKMNRLRSICLRNKCYKLPKLHRHVQYSFSNSITPNVKTDFKKRIIPISSVLGITGASYYFYNNYKNKQNNFSNVASNKPLKKESNTSKKKQIFHYLRHLLLFPKI